MPHEELMHSDPPQVGLGKALRSASNAFYRHLRDELARDGVGFSEFQHLNQLWRAEGLSQVELARRIGIGRASSTSVLDRLEQRGLIERARDASDRRVFIVRLTEEGRALKHGLWERAAAVNRKARAGLSEAEAGQLFDLLDRVARNLSDPA